MQVNRNIAKGILTAKVITFTCTVITTTITG
jgi:hypothetical protein